MSNFLGVHWMAFHQNASDFDHMAHMQYSSATIFEWMWSDAGFCSNLNAVMPKDAVILNRDHPMSEQWDRFLANPADCGRGHADEWAQKVREGKVHTPLDRTLFLGLNEPNSNTWQRQIDRYNETFCRRMAEHGLRACAYSFGVGHPSTVDLQPTALPDWSFYAASAAAILEGHHWVSVHEYGAASGYGWGYWCDRLQYCPYPFTVIIQEAGIDGGVVNQPKQGYLSYMSPAAYMPWLDGYLRRMLPGGGQRKAFVHSVQPFTYDANRDWHSFDIREGRAELEAYSWPQAPVRPVTPPQPTPPQPVPPQPTPAGKLAHPLPGASITQHFYQNPDAYARFGLPGHNGTDLGGVPEGVPVAALADGEVAFVDTDADYGEYIRLWHPTLQAHSFYAHLRVRSPLQVGHAVQAGMPIGQVGSTGNSTGPHLHLEIRAANASGEYIQTSPMPKGRVDPETFCAVNGLKLGG